MPRESVIGREIYDRVTSLLAADPSMTRQAAFSKVADERGSQQGTVAANYYREARKAQGGTRTKRQRSAGPSRARTSSNHSANVPTSAEVREVTEQIQSGITRLVDMIERQQEAYESARRAFM